MREPRDPLLKVLLVIYRKAFSTQCLEKKDGPEATVHKGVEDELGPKTKSLMILPQVHLRKPCYDFYFL